MTKPTNALQMILPLNPNENLDLDEFIATLSKCRENFPINRFHISEARSQVILRYLEWMRAKALLSNPLLFTYSQVNDLVIELPKVITNYVSKKALLSADVSTINRLRAFIEDPRLTYPFLKQMLPYLDTTENQDKLNNLILFLRCFIIELCIVASWYIEDDPFTPVEN